MDKSTIQTLIDKVIGKKGLIRVPSWWMRKVLMQIADWVQEGDDANDEKIGNVKEEADGKISNLKTNINSEISYLKNLSLPYMLVSGTGIVNIDGNEISFTDADKQLIYITGAINFKKNSSANDLITYIYIPHLDIRSQGRDMSYMFNYCKSLTSLDLTGLDTSSVTNMQNMFESCWGLTSLDLSSFDTSSVTNMQNMFKSCSYLTSLNLTGIDTSSVTDMQSMFKSCASFTSLDLTDLDTSSVTDMQSMFDYCWKLTSLNLSSFDTSSVTNMSYMFQRCGPIISLDLSSFDTSAVISMYGMFYDSSIISLNLSSFDTSAVASMGQMFTFCSRLTSLILGPNFFKTSKVASIDFSGCIKWTNDTVVASLVTNSYDRATAGLSTMTLQLSANTKAALTDEQKAAITAKGYTIA